MTAQIVSLGGLDDEDENFAAFAEEIKKDNVSAVFLLEKEDGSVTVGCNYKDKRDLVFAIVRLQRLAQSIVEEEI